MASSRFNDEQRAFARAQLKLIKIPRDRLPYTEDFEDLYGTFCDNFIPAVSRAEYWRLLASVAKQGGMAKDPQ